MTDKTLNEFDLGDLIDYVNKDMATMTDAERVELMNRLMAGYCKHCGTRCIPCSCQEFWMEH